MKNIKTILILVIGALILIVVGSLWLAINFQKPKTDENLLKTMKGENVTSEEAVRAVRNLPEVKEYEALLAQDDKAATIEAEDNDTEWNVHVYEIVVEEGAATHMATFGWYQVNKNSGEVFSENSFYDDGVSGEKLPIQPAELMPYVSREQARAAVCAGSNGELFEEACQEKFDKVGKKDKEKIDALFSLLKKIENDRSISDYERYLLGQVVFASLPIKDSPLSYRSGFSASMAKLESFINNIGNVAHAQEIGMGEEEFNALMKSDLEKVLNNLPKGDNAWVINVMVSKYSWVNGERQPIYSDQYAESYDPYPGVSTEKRDERTILYHVKSVVGSRATSQAINEGPFKGTGEMVAYSFAIMSWNSPAYGSDSVLVVAEAGPEAKYMTSRQDFSEKNYRGENFLSGLLTEVKMPSREQPATSKTFEVKQTSWGGVDDWGTAYENYFWMHLQQPQLYPTFWDAYNGESAVSQALRALPMGEPVDLRAYLNTSGVREYYESLRKNGAIIPQFDELLNNIDQYQSNLDLAKPQEDEKPEPTPSDDVGSEAEESDGPNTTIAPSGTPRPDVNWVLPR